MSNQKQKPIRTSVHFLNPEKILAKLNLHEEMIIAHFGCGAGYFTFPAAKMVGEGGLVYAVDIQKPALSGIESKMALLGIRNIKPVWANLEILGATKIEKESVDLVLLVNILFQSKKHKEIFEEAKRVLKKDGTLLVIDWKKTEAPMGPEILIRVDKDQLRHQAEEVGFKLVRETEASPYHYELVFIK